MKKQYITPAISIVKVEVSGPLAESVTANPGATGVKKGDALSRRKPDNWNWKDGAE
jgi:hypothetical protein